MIERNFRSRILSTSEAILGLRADAGARTSSSSGSNWPGRVAPEPVASLEEGHALLQVQPDGGILDIRLGDQLVYPLADDLLAAGIPVIFASSENRSSVPDKYSSIALLSRQESLSTTGAMKGGSEGRLGGWVCY